MLSSSPKDPLTLWTTAVSLSLSSSTSIASLTSRYSSLCFTPSAPSLPSISSFLPLLLSVSCLFLVLSSRRGSGSSTSKHYPSLSYSFGLPKSLYSCAILVLVLTLTATSAGALPAEYHHKKSDVPQNNGMIEKHPHDSSLVQQRTISISTARLSHHNDKSSTSSSGLLNSYQNDQSTRTLANSYQRDQPPRRTTNTSEFHDHIKVTQGRVFYLRASNQQYLQVYNRTITGTRTTRPVLGLLQSYRDGDNFLIRHRNTNEYLCMNEHFQLYLDWNYQNSNCHMQDGVLDDKLGLYKFTFQFKRYRGRYLGIDCNDPVLTVMNPSLPSSPIRFFIQLSSLEKAKEAEKKIGRDGLTAEGVLGKTCTSEAERKRQEEILREKHRRDRRERLHKKLRQRWCWSFPRMLKNKTEFISSCEERHNRCRSDSYRGRDSGGECVCDFLREMLEDPKKAQFKCLREKILLWVQHQNVKPNRKVVTSVAKRLRRHYRGIARRMRETRCFKKHRDNEDRHHPCRKKVRGIKINGILKEFKSELIIDRRSRGPLRTKPSKKFSRALKNIDGGSCRERRRRHRRRCKKRPRKRSKTVGVSPSFITSPAPD